MRTSNKNKILFNISDQLTNDSEFSREYLIEEGMNPDTIVSNGINKLKQFQLQQKAQANKSQNSLNYQKALNLLKNRVNSAGNSINDVINSITNVPQFQFRNVESLTEDDLKDVFNELQIIELMEEIEKGNVQ